LTEETEAAFTINLANLTSVQQSSITAFNYYRINAVSFRFYPLSNVAGITYQPADFPAFPNGTIPIYTLWEPNLERLWTGPEIVNHPNAKIHNQFQPFTCYTKVRNTFSLTVGNNVDVSTMLRGAKVRFSTTDLNANQGRLYVSTGALPTGDGVDNKNFNPQYKIYITYYLTLFKFNAT